MNGDVNDGNLCEESPRWKWQVWHLRSFRECYHIIYNLCKEQPGFIFHSTSIQVAQFYSSFRGMFAALLRSKYHVIIGSKYYDVRKYVNICNMFSLWVWLFFSFVIKNDIQSSSHESFLRNRMNERRRNKLWNITESVGRERDTLPEMSFMFSSCAARCLIFYSKSTSTFY